LSQIFRKYIQIFLNSRYLFFLNITDRLFSFIIFLLLARNLSPILYGEIITFFTICSITAALHDLGLSAYLQREMASGVYDKSYLFSTVMTANLLFLISYSIILSVIYYFFYSGSGIIIFIIISFLSYSSLLTETCSKALSGIRKFKEQFYSFVITRIVLLIAFALGIYLFRISIILLLVFFASGIFVNFVLNYLYLRKEKIKFYLKNINLSEVFSVLKTTFPLGLAVIFTFLYNKIDIVLISAYLDYSQVGYYSIAYGLYKSASLAFSFLLISGFTHVSEIRTDKKAVLSFAKEYAYIILSICIASAIILYFFAEFLINFFYTNKFSESAPVLKVLSFAVIAIGLNNLTGIIINGIGLFKAVMYVTIMATIINVLINIITIPVYGIIAAAWVTVITEYIILIFEIYILSKALRA
jgi:O-antigen/teichoic acid export membrane protein